MKAVLAASAAPNAVGHLLAYVHMRKPQVIREYLYIYAAVAPARGRMVSLVLPEASTSMMNLFLEQVSQTFSKDFIIMQGGLCWLASFQGSGHS